MNFNLNLYYALSVVTVTRNGNILVHSASRHRHLGVMVDSQLILYFQVTCNFLFCCKEVSSSESDPITKGHIILVPTYSVYQGRNQEDCGYFCEWRRDFKILVYSRHLTQLSSLKRLPITLTWPHSFAQVI